MPCKSLSIWQESMGRHRLLESKNGNILKIDPGLASDAGVYTCEVAGKDIRVSHVVKDTTTGDNF